MQAHTGSWMEPATQNAILDHFAESGVPLHYTEFWAHNDHLIKSGIDAQTAEEMKAEYVANFLTVAFAHPSVASFFFWGDLTKSFGFRPDENSSGLPSSSHEPTRTYWRVRQLLQEEWMTRENLVTDEGGRIRLRGFFGDYALRYQAGRNMPAGAGFTLDRRHEGLIRLTVHAGSGGR